MTEPAPDIGTAAQSALPILVCWLRWPGQCSATRTSFAQRVFIAGSGFLASFAFHREVERMGKVHDWERNSPRLIFRHYNRFGNQWGR